MHLRTFPDHQKKYFKNDFFDLQECLKTCFDAFAHTSRPPVWSVLCFCTRLQTTSNFFSIKIFLNVLNHFFKKDFFDRQECLKTCLHAFAHISRPPETFLQKWFFRPSGMLKNVFWCICTCLQTTSNFFSK